MVGRVKTGDECTHGEPRRDFLFLSASKVLWKVTLGGGEENYENKTDILYYNRPLYRGSVLKIGVKNVEEWDGVEAISSDDDEYSV